MPDQLWNQARAAYERGWRASQRYAASTSYQVFTPLERADERGEPAAWYRGYEDHSADRPKWYSLEETDPAEVKAQATVDATDPMGSEFDTPLGTGEPVKISFPGADEPPAPGKRYHQFLGRCWCFAIHTSMNEVTRLNREVSMTTFVRTHESVGSSPFESTTPTIAERAAAYRADPKHNYGSQYMHDRVRLFSPGFAFLGFENAEYDPGSSYSRRYYHLTHQPILFPAAWMAARTSAEGAAKRNQHMTLRWRRI